MFDHLGIVVSDLAISESFYTPLLATLGLELLQDNSDGTEGWLVYGTNPGDSFLVVSCGVPSFWSAHHVPSRSPVHIAFTARSRLEVENFYRVGLECNGKSNGAPGDRPSPTDYYACYLIDPDGNNVEAGYRPPPNE